MWLFTKYGFYSVVCAREDGGWNRKVDPDKLMVRARSKKHLESLQERFPELKQEILVTEHNDYRFRIFVDKPVWSKIMSVLSDELDYDNFKDKAKKHTGDNDYVSALADVWGVMYRFQTEQEEGSISAWDVWKK